MELDDLALERAKRGDDEATRALVLRYQRPVQQLLWRMLDCQNRRAAVDDLVQETFLRVFVALPRFDSLGPARLSTWIITIATRLALKELRKAPSATLDEATPSEDRADAGSERRMLGQTVRRALATLPPDQRAVILLRDVHELTYEEVAATLGIELGTVRSRLARARAAMRAALGGHAHE